MTSIYDIQEAIARVLAKRWPERMIYRDFCPVDFQRPSFFLWTTETELTPVNLALAQWSGTMTLEIFCETDHYDESSAEQLRAEQAEVLRLFGSPKMPVGDRFIEVSATGSGQDPGSAFVEFSAAWVDQRPGYAEPEHQLMKDYSLRHAAGERNEET